jgi:hypothetical protein
MSLHDRVPLELAERKMGKQGVETDRLARIIRKRLPEFLDDCDSELANDNLKRKHAKATSGPGWPD